MSDDTNEAMRRLAKSMLPVNQQTELPWDAKMGREKHMMWVIHSPQKVAITFMQTQQLTASEVTDLMERLRYIQRVMCDPWSNI